ncbi:MAG TPA: hypothetical protein VMS88_02270 [Terriglobales bacterium]|nr:hypothetical protein [Terriglobales bacterium]
MLAALLLGPVERTIANPIPDRSWMKALALPGAYLRSPTEENRRALELMLGQGHIDLLLRRPDTLALIVHNIEAFAPVFVASQTRPFVPDGRIQAWFRTTARTHRDEMIRALRTWLVPGPDSLAPHAENQILESQILAIGPGARQVRLVKVQSGVARLLAEWDAREVLPDLRALRENLADSASQIGAYARAMLLEDLDRAIGLLEGRPDPEPLFPDGHGGFQSGKSADDIDSACVDFGAGRKGLLWLGPAERGALWRHVAAARETLFDASYCARSIQFYFHDLTMAEIAVASAPGALEVSQRSYSRQGIVFYPTRHIWDERLCAWLFGGPSPVAGQRGP